MKTINILNTEDINLLQKLTPNTKAEFGIMQPQHMIEHLILTLEYSNGEKTTGLVAPEEVAKQLKPNLIYSDLQITAGIKSPLLPENDVLPLTNENIETAINILKEKLEKYKQYFKENPEIEPVNPILGSLNFEEWTIFHNKHFSHHFRQFKLIE